MTRLSQQYKDKIREAGRETDQLHEAQHNKIPPWLREKPEESNWSKAAEEVTKADEEFERNKINKYQKEVKKRDLDIGKYAQKRFLDLFGNKITKYSNSKLGILKRCETGEVAIEVLNKINITKHKIIEIIDPNGKSQKHTIQQLVDQNHTAGHIEDLYNSFTEKMEVRNSIEPGCKILYCIEKSVQRMY